MKILTPFVLLFWLAFTARHPALGLALGVVIVAWPFIKWAVRIWPEGFFFAKGVKASHLLDPPPPRQ